MRIYKTNLQRKYLNKSFLFFSLFYSLCNAQTPATEAYGYCPKCTTSMTFADPPLSDSPPVAYQTKRYVAKGDNYLPDGYWFSNNNTDNAKIANATNQLIGFAVGTGLNKKIYSTGVNDALLTSKGVAYEANNYKAFPVTITAPATGSHFIGLPKWDENGVYRNTNYGAPPPCDIPREYYLRDGTNGLDLSTLLFNIGNGTAANDPARLLSFNVDVLADVNPEFLFNTAPPAIIVTQMGAPGGTDTFRFTTADGTLVGGEIQVQFGGGTVPPIGRARYALYNTNGLCGTPSGNYTFATNHDNASDPNHTGSGNSNFRDTRVLSFKLSDFGLNNNPSSPAYYRRAVKFVHQLSGDSDPAFNAYNTKALNIYCYENPTSGTGLDTTVGISAIGRAGAADADNWPMDRKGGWIALESNKKPMVITRATTTEINNIANPMEGMLVYDTVDHCMKMYVNSTIGWRCFNRKTCP